MGELTAAIAHEINQPLGAILANADAAEMLLETDASRIGEVRQILADIRRDDLRASEVIRRLRALLSRHETERKPVELGEAVAEIVRVVDGEAHRRDATLEIAAAPSLPPVTGDRVQLQQVVLNLVLNALDAMAEIPAANRRLTVRVSRAAGGVEIQVADRGPGIAPERMERIFQSFYTTKHGGMGLGLAVARTIVDAHRGQIWAERNPGGGALFRIILPAATAASVVATTESPLEQPA
jgi:C4-dicarboxylate-specific signal transduction histidine kinase